MKTYIRTLVLVAVLITAGTASLLAQYSSTLRLVEVSSFNQVEINSDIEVIFKKSSRDFISFTGDSSFINSIEILQENGTLSFNYQTGIKDSLALVIVEYKDLNKVMTGGTGTYYFPKMELVKLEIVNPEANIFLSGYADNLRIVSKEGTNDVTSLEANKMFFHLGDEAKLIQKSDEVLFSSLN